MNEQSGNSAPRTAKHRVGALWRGQSKNGGEYVSGSLDRKSLEEALKRTQGDKIRIMMSKNNFHREGSKDPNWHLFCPDLDYTKPGVRANQSGPKSENFQGGGDQWSSGYSEPTPRSGGDDEIPF